MRVTIASQGFDLQGFLELECLPDVNSGEVVRRVNRVATLDGGAAFNDFGFSDADRTIELRWMPVSEAHTQQAATLVQRHNRVLVAMPDGLYLAAPERFKPSPTECSITLLVERKLS